MRLCLSCFYLNGPPGGKGSDNYCPGCGRSYGRICGRCRTPAPWGSRFCPACGSGELSDPANSLPLGALPRVLILLACVLAFRESGK
jgi:hypothetical protein